MLLASLEEDGVTLSSVLCKVRVNEVDKIVSDRSAENSGHGNLGDDFGGVVALVDGHNRACGHFVYLINKNDNNE